MSGINNIHLCFFSVQFKCLYKMLLFSWLGVRRFWYLRNLQAYTCLQRVKISGTKCTITTVAAFHTEMKLAKAEMRNHLLNTSPWATLPYKVVDEEWCRPTKRNHNKWNTTACTTAIRSATKEYHPCNYFGVD